MHKKIHRHPSGFEAGKFQKKPAQFKSMALSAKAQAKFEKEFAELLKIAHGEK